MTARDANIHADRRIARAIPARTTGANVGTVLTVLPSIRRAQILLDGSQVPITCDYPALPTPLVAGDKVAVEVSRGGWQLIGWVLARDPDPVPPPTPPGTVVAFAAATAPDGWLLCDGASYLRTDWPALFAAIGTVFGAADAQHFNVPSPSAPFASAVWMIKT